MSNRKSFTLRIQMCGIVRKTTNQMLGHKCGHSSGLKSTQMPQPGALLSWSLTAPSHSIILANL